MTIDWREELKRMEREKEILDRAFEEGRLCWYREPWEEDPYPAEEMEEEVKNGFWEEDETPSYPDEETTRERYWWAKWVR